MVPRAVLRHQVLSTLLISAAVVVIAVGLSVVSYQLVGEARPGLLYEALSALGIGGLLGSGRTEFALSLFGMNRPTSGEIRLYGKPLALKTNAQAIAEGIAYVSEDRLSLGLVLEQPISSNILVTVLDKLPNRLGLVAEETRRRTARTG